MGGGVLEVYSPGCDCERRAREEQERARAAKEHQDRLDRLFHEARLDRRFEAASFENFRPVGGTEFALERCRDLVDNWADWYAEGRGLLLVGEHGCGKTHLAAACVNALVRKFYSALFVSVPDYLEQLRAHYRIEQHGGYSAEDLEDFAGRADLLVLDDLGAERLLADERGDWIRDRLHALVDRRYRRELPTVITTNCDEGQLERRCGYRILRRLNEMLEPAPITAGDYQEGRVG
jgi:DNA replication protein DnaC